MSFRDTSCSTNLFFHNRHCARNAEKSTVVLHVTDTVFRFPCGHVIAGMPRADLSITRIKTFLRAAAVGIAGSFLEGNYDIRERFVVGRSSRVYIIVSMGILSHLLHAITVPGISPSRSISLPEPKRGSYLLGKENPHDFRSKATCWQHRSRNAVPLAFQRV